MNKKSRGKKPPSAYKRKTRKAPELDPVQLVSVPGSDLFATPEDGEQSGRDKLMHDIDILITEWALFHPNHSVRQFLMDAKGYSDSQHKAILAIVPAEDWPKRRVQAQDKLTETLIKRHVDMIATAQDEHISASKLGLARAVGMLAKGSSGEMRNRKGELLLDKDGKVIHRTLSSLDIMQCLTAVEKAQNIYRRAMGLPNEEGGLQQIIDRIDRMKEHTTTINLQQNIQHNTVNATGVKGPDDLTYEEIILLVEAQRAQKAKMVEYEDSRLVITHKEGVPTGDFTAKKPNLVQTKGEST